MIRENSLLEGYPDIILKYSGLNHILCFLQSDNCKRNIIVSSQYTWRKTYEQICLKTVYCKEDRLLKNYLIKAACDNFQNNNQTRRISWRNLTPSHMTICLNG